MQTILNLGDMTGYGPNPEAVVRWSQGSQILNIQGNYDKKVISKVYRDEKWRTVNDLTNERCLPGLTGHSQSHPAITWAPCQNRVQ